MVQVLRNGMIKTLAAAELVPGDIIRVRIGDIIPADIKVGIAHSGATSVWSRLTPCPLTVPLVPPRSWKSQLTEGNEIKVDQSSLTGESLPVSKHAGDEAFSGSVVKHGEAEALVHATGTTHHPASCATRARRPRAVIRAPAARCMHRKSNVLWASRGTDRAGVQDGPSPARA